MPTRHARTSRLRAATAPLWLAALAATWLAAAAGELRAAEQAPVALVLGDSLSAAYALKERQGWVALAAKDPRLAPVRIVNASVSGETTAGGLARLPALLKKHRPDIVLIQLGANDGLRGHSLAGIEKNLAAAIRLAQGSGARVLLLGMHLPPNYGARYARGFHALYEKLARAHRTERVDFLLAGVARRPELMKAGGSHPTAEAQPLILENVVPALRAMLEKEQASAGPAGSGSAASKKLPR